MAQLFFWTALLLIALSYFGYPVILILLAYFKKKSLTKGKIEPNVSLLIAAYNEENVIQQKIENSLLLDYPKEKLEIILILDGCTDRTKQIAERYIDRGIKIIEQKPRKGKMAALNLTVPQARGEIIVFTDADIILDTKAIKYLIENFSDERIGCVGGDLVYASDDSSLLAAGENLYFKYDKFLRRKESEMGTLFVVSGSIYAIRKKLFSPIDKDLADDFVNPIRIASQGFRVIYEPRAKAIGKIAKTIRDEFRQKVRMTSQGFKASTKIFNFISSKNYIYVYEFLLHKFLRWLVPLFLIVIFFSNILLLSNKFYKITFLGQMLFYLFSLIGYLLEERHISIKIFYIPFYFTIVNLASLIGLLRFLRGGLKGTWEKAETTRR